MPYTAGSGAGCFSIVRTKIIHYSSLAYFPLTWLAAHYIYQVISQKGVFSKFTRVSAAIAGTAWLLAVLFIVVLFLNKDAILSSGWIRDAFTTANLQAEVSWSGWEVLVVLPLLAGLITFYVIRDPLRRVTVIFIGTLVFSFVTMGFILPKAEGYTQRAAIEFYRRKAGKIATSIHWDLKVTLICFMGARCLPSIRCRMTRNGS